MSVPSIDMITILGPTATGKTSFAAALAAGLNGEIISADSRQVYKEMNLGTGKDYEDYNVAGKKIPYHLIDIVEPGSEYNVYYYQRDFLKSYADIKERGLLPILCGGTGMYLEASLVGYELTPVPENKELRAQLEGKPMEELAEILMSLRPVHNTTDVTLRARAIRAIEIETYNKENPSAQEDYPKINSMVFGIKLDRYIVRERITKRLRERLENGMIEEVKELLDRGITPDRLKFYGLEYKFLTMHVLGEINYEDMFEKLNIGIHQFAKRQATWFRRMERKGIEINWIDGNLTTTERVESVLLTLKKEAGE